MNINGLMAQRSLTRYRLSKDSGVPYTTINDICSGKVNIGKSSADTVYKLAKTLNVLMEELLDSSKNQDDVTALRVSFEVFKSNVCHRVKDLGDVDFIIDTLQSDEIRKYYIKKWYPESLYLLAMVDYLCRLNDLPLSKSYNDLRTRRLSSTLYPAGVEVGAAAMKNDKWKVASLRDSIPEFARFNIVENEVRDVL